MSGRLPTVLKSGVNRTFILNRLIDVFRYTRYLEIGVFKGGNLDNIDCAQKVSVDPDALVEVTHKMTSDQFFSMNKDQFDLVFIDGLHLEIQTDLDFANALDCLSDNGSIVFHDTNPQSEWMQRDEFLVNGDPQPWNGTVWKTIAKLRCSRSDLEIYTVDTDHGVTIVRRGEQDCFAEMPMKMNFEFLDSNRIELLNLISVGQFNRLFPLEHVG